MYTRMKKYLTYISLIIVTAAIINGIYKQTTKEAVPGKAKRIPCMAKTTSFERGYDKEGIKKAQDILRSGNYILSSGTDRSKYMDSTLFDHVDMKKLDDYLNKEIEKNISKKDITKAPVKIEYKVYENDKEDPKKKSDKCKLFRGYVVMKFLNSKNKALYQVQIDFMDGEGKDIPQKLRCGLEAFLTYN